jgi:hypothetical protein
MKNTTRLDPLAEALQAGNEHIILMLPECVADHTEVEYHQLPKAVEKISSSCLKFILKQTCLKSHPFLQAVLDQMLHNALI